jgi:thiol-disulfide isomerase/thioredoxin
MPRRRQRARTIGRQLPLLAAVLFAGCSTSARQSDLPIAPQAQGTSTAAKQDGAGGSTSVIRFVRDPDPAPPFTLKDLDGKPLSLEGTRGKVTLLNFWATWCPPCRAEIPDLIALQKKYADKLQIIALSLDEGSPESVKKFARASGMNYPVAIAPAELSAQYGGIPALPTSFVLDTEGRVVQKHVGLRDPALYEAEIRALLGLPVPARVETFEDTGEVFLRHADRATELPGVDMSSLSGEQKKVALHRFNSENCTCPCALTLAQCRMNDTSCAVSKAITDKLIDEIKDSSAKDGKPSAAPAKPDSPGAP